MGERRQLNIWPVAALLAATGLLVAPPTIAATEPELAPELFEEAAFDSRVTAARKTPFGAALVEAFESPDVFRPIRVFTRCATENGYKQAEIFGNGVTIWNNESQILFPPRAVRSFLRMLIVSGFAEMPAVFGSQAESNQLGVEAAERAPLRILCEVEAEIGDEHRRVEQQNKGERSELLEALAHSLLKAIRVRAPFGVSADDLADALAKVAGGQLKPETFRLIFHEKPELSATETNGLLMHLRAHRLTIRRSSGDSGYGQPATRRLDEAELGKVVRQIEARGFAELPGNLFAGNYIDLTVEVLKHRKSIQARRFAGIDATTHGAAQYDFEALVKAVRGLAAESEEEPLEERDVTGAGTPEP